MRIGSAVCADTAFAANVRTPDKTARPAMPDRLLSCRRIRGIVSVTETIGIMSRPSDLVQGTLDALILSLLARQPLHGLAISHRLRESSADVLQVSHGSLYPALHKLEHSGLIRAEWRPSESGKRA